MIMITSAGEAAEVAAGDPVQEAEHEVLVVRHLVPHPQYLD